MSQVSVVVPTRGRRQQVRRVLESTLADPGVLEVVVVVDGDDPTSLAPLHELASCEPRLRVLWQPHAGAGAARQRGVEHAHGRIVLLLDDDAVPRPGLASGHAAAHAGSDEDLVVVGALRTPESARRTVDSVTTDLYISDYAVCVEDWQRDPSSVLRHLWAGNLSLPRERALTVGLDDPEMGALFFEDLDLGLRLSAAGVRGVFRPDLVAAHEHNRTLRRFLDDAYRQGEALLLLHQRYPEHFPEPTSSALSGRAPLPARLLIVAAGSGQLATRLLPEVALAATVVAGRLRLWRLQRLLAVLLRRVGQAAGVARACAGGPGRG
jgi:glycosyltransferase involved in cell wall biosynthesis